MALGRVGGFVYLPRMSFNNHEIELAIGFLLKFPSCVLGRCPAKPGVPASSVLMANPSLRYGCVMDIGMPFPAGVVAARGVRTACEVLLTRTWVGTSLRNHGLPKWSFLPSGTPQESQNGCRCCEVAVESTRPRRPQYSMLR